MLNFSMTLTRNLYLQCSGLVIKRVSINVFHAYFVTHVIEIQENVLNIAKAFNVPLRGFYHLFPKKEYARSVGDGPTVSEQVLTHSAHFTLISCSCSG